MIRFMMGLVFMLVGAVMALGFIKDGGYVLVIWHQTSIEMSLILMVIIGLLALFYLFIMLELMLGVLGLRTLLQKWLNTQRYQRTQQYLTQGMALLAQEEYAAAEKILVRSAKLSQDPLVAYLGAVQAAQALQATQRAEDYLNLIANKHHLTVHIARMRLWIASGQWEAAAARLKESYSHYKKELIINQLLLEVLLKLHAWSDLVEWLPTLSKSLSFESVSQQTLLHTAYQQLFNYLGKTTGRTDKYQALEQLQHFWQQLPRHTQRDAEVVCAYVNALISIACYDESARICCRVLGEQWHHGLVALYGRILHAQPQLALEQAQQWQKIHPQSPVLLLTLGRLSMQCCQWAEAKAYFEQSLTLHKNPEVFAEFVRLLQHSNDPQAGQYLIAGLNQLLEQPLPAIPLP